MAANKIIIFDFDGTLADSAPIIRAIYAEVAAKNGLRVMTDEDYTNLRREVWVMPVSGRAFVSGSTQYWFETSGDL